MTRQPLDEGRVFSYEHHDGKLGVLLELASETDFGARHPAFLALGHDLCLHIAARRPHCLDGATATDAGFDLRDCLLEQRWLKDERKSVADVLSGVVEDVGEPVEIVRFACFDRKSDR